MARGLRGVSLVTTSLKALTESVQSEGEERDFINWWDNLSTYEKIMLGTPLPIPTGKEMLRRSKLRVVDGGRA